ncbi:MAG: carbonic anhydrase [Alphaproteobacteria bacterium]|nr:carbonic anhydrase [Alphaproteobacteria bacterium]
MMDEVGEFEKLLRGYRDFRKKSSGEHSTSRQILPEIQSPAFMIISCSDSRVVPEFIFGTSPGEALVLRNVANIVPPYDTDAPYQGVAAALEFGILALSIKHVVIMGHHGCGGITAYLQKEREGLSQDDAIGKWVGLLADAEQHGPDKDKTDLPRQTRMEHAAITYSLENLRSFPYIAKKEKAGDLHLHGMWFDIRTLDLLVYNKHENIFYPVIIAP